AFARLLDVLLYGIDQPFDLRHRDGPLLGRLHHTGQHFFAREGFARAVFLDDHIRNFVYALVTRKAPLAPQALAAAANHVAFTTLTRIHDTVFQMCAEWT